MNIIAVAEIRKDSVSLRIGEEAVSISDDDPKKLVAKIYENLSPRPAPLCLLGMMITDVVEAKNGEDEALFSWTQGTASEEVSVMKFDEQGTAYRSR